MSNPLISFCIPTYKRSSFIKKSLSSILQYAGNDIEVVVINNDSPDDTEAVILSFGDERISYYKNPENIGAIRNMIRTFNEAKGKWVFSLSDEDIVTADIIEFLISAVQNPQFEGAAVMLGNLRNSAGPYPYYVYHDGKNYVPYKFENKVYSKGDEAIKAAGFYYKYFSGAMIRRDCIDFTLLNNYNSKDCGIVPHNSALTLACAMGDAVTFDADFVIKTVEEDKNSYVENVNNNNYKHPDNRWVQMKYYANMAIGLYKEKSFLLETLTDNFGYYLDVGIYGWYMLLKRRSQLLKFDIEDQGEFDIVKESLAFKNNVKELYASLISDSSFNQRLDTSIEERYAYYLNKRNLR